MANVIQWTGALPAGSAVLGTEMNSLANGSRTNAGTAYANGTNANMYGWLEAVLAFGSAPTAGNTIEIYMVAAPDGTNYSDGSSTVAPTSPPVAVFDLTAATSQRRFITQPFLLPPCPVKFIAVNRSGVALSSSGSSVTLYTNNPEVQ